MRFVKTSVLVLAVMAFMAGCNNKSELPKVAAMPAVNDENCKPEHVKKLDTNMQQQFSSACLRRGSFKPSSGQTW